MELQSKFGKYYLLKKINTGGMAEIFLAVQSGLEGFEKLTAIKRILPHLSGNEEFISMFINEAKLAAQLTHPNIVHIYDFGKTEEAYYIAMEYLAGKNLKEILKRCREKKITLPVKQAALIIRCACKALDYAHRKRDLNNKLLNLVHRDVSPQNILISYEGEVKIVDFGIAKAALHSQETRVGMLKGKLAYMSPEQAMGKKLDHRSDIFSLGIVLYELLTGTRLFRGNSEFSLLEKVKEAKIEPPRKLNKEISPGLEQILLKALAVKPKDRFQTAGHMRQALDKVLKIGEESDASPTLIAFMGRLFSDNIRNEANDLRRLLEGYKGLDAEKTVAATIGKSQQAGQKIPPAVDTQLPAPKKGFKKVVIGACLIVSLIVGTLMLMQSKYWPAVVSKWSVMQKTLLSGNDNKTPAAQPVKPLPVLLPGTLKITANVSDAAIFLDGEIQPRFTAKDNDVLITDISPGEKHTVEFIKDGYTPWETSFKVASGKEYSITLDMQAIYATLQISSDPSGAQVYLNDELIIGKETPAEVEKLIPGRQYSISLRKKGYLPWEKTFTPKPNEELLFENIKLTTSYAKLQIGSDPPGAQIFLDDKLALYKITPSEIDKLIPGKKYTVGLRKKGYAPWRKSFVPKEGEIVSFKNIQLKILYGKLKIESDPPGADIVIFGHPLIDKVTPAVIDKLLPGKKYTISLRKAGYAAWQKPFNVQAKTTTSLSAALQRLYGKLTINSVPWSSIYFENKKLGVTPLAGLKLPVGTHELKLVNSTVGIDELLSVKIDFNQVTNKMVRFEGSFTINALPWAKVYIDDEEKGITPLAGIKLLAGVHQVRLVNSELKQDRTFKILIKPNRTTSKIVNLNEK